MFNQHTFCSNGQRERSNTLRPVASGVGDHLPLLLLRPTVEVMLHRTCIEEAYTVGGSMYGVNRVGGDVSSLMRI